MFRSQIAEVFYNRLSADGSVANSCGTWVELEQNPNKTLAEIGSQTAIEVMKEIGIDVSRQKAWPITPDLVSDAEKVVVMVEEETWPDYLKNNSKVVRWEVENPKLGDLDTCRRVRQQIYDLVSELLLQ